MTWGKWAIDFASTLAIALSAFTLGYIAGTTEKGPR
jgi:hypothetical protein